MGMRMQSKKHSLYESFLNVLVGYAVAILSQIIIFPFFDINMTISQNLLIGLYFTIISVIRSYFLRRLFNKILHRKYNAND